MTERKRPSSKTTSRKSPSKKAAGKKLPSNKKSATQTDRSKSVISDNSNNLGIEPGTYNQVVNCATLREIRLIESYFSLAPEYFSSDPDAEEISLSRDQSEGDVDYFEEDGVLVAGFRFAVLGERDGERLLDCHAKYIVFFALEEQVDRNAALVFAKRTGKNATYPYFREFVASQSWASGADLPILPILRSAPPKSKTKETQEATGRQRR